MRSMSYPVSILNRNRFATNLPADYTTVVNAQQPSSLHMQDTSKIITQKGGVRSRGVESGMQSVGGVAMVNLQGVSNSETDRCTEGSQHLEWYQRPPFVEANVAWYQRPPSPEAYGQIGALGSPRNRSSMSNGGMNADNRRNSDGGGDDGRQESRKVGKWQFEDPLMDDVKELHRLVSQRGSARAKAAESGSSAPSNLSPPSPFPQGAQMEQVCGEFPASEERKGGDENRKSEPGARENVDVKSIDAGLAPQVVGVNSSVVLSTVPSFPRVLELAICNLFNICLCGVEMCLCASLCVCGHCVYCVGGGGWWGEWVFASVRECTCVCLYLVIFEGTQVMLNGHVHTFSHVM
jgi:hypothetical protein